MFVTVAFVPVSYLTMTRCSGLQLADCVNISEFSEVRCHSCDCPGTRADVT